MDCGKEKAVLRTKHSTELDLKGDKKADNSSGTMHYGSKQGDIETLNFTLFHELESEQSERASERMSAAERAGEASSAGQVNE